MRKVLVVLALGALGLFSLPTNAGAVTPKTALMFGDSLTSESRFVITTRLTARRWTGTVHSFASTAPCDWNGWLAADLARYQPAMIGILTAGNSQGSGCMTAPLGSDAYYAQYAADLEQFVATAVASGARVVYFNSPPFLDPARNAAVIRINAIAKSLAGRYHGVSIANGVRAAVGGSGGKYVQTKPCLTTEKALPGCVGGSISVRTEPGYVDYGLHLCPTGLPAGSNSICSTYSSGEFRFGRAVANQLVTPPKPLLP